MKNLFFILYLSFTIGLFAQQEQNSDKGIAAKGYDVVAYFSNQTLEGKIEYQLKYRDLIYRFSNESNRNLFKANPSKYAPQYGGWCAYAMSKHGSKVDINPETYEIRDGKLYLFYNKWGTNTLESWKKEGPDKLKIQADLNWKKT